MKRLLTIFCLLAMALNLQAQSGNNINKDLPFNPFGHPLIPDMVADPSIVEIDGMFYCYVTTDGYGQGLETSGPPVVWKSRDFVNWSFDGTYFPQAVGEKYWAPSKPVYKKGHWYIYPTVNGYMYPAVSDSHEGPFHLAKGNRFTIENRLLEKDSVCAIDTEMFIDDDGTPYAIWGLRNVARLKDDMTTIDTLVTIDTRKKQYTEGPIFFKRKGIYYYLYTQMALERYEYYYQMSRESPFGPYETPRQDVVCTTDAETGVFGPGHGCVFHPEGTDDYYLVFLEFSRNSTNRQIYANKLEFNDDGTIRQVRVTLNGVGALRQMMRTRHLLQPVHMNASSVAEPEKVPYKLDKRCQRTEYFVPEFAVDGSNGSRWMASSADTTDCWLMADLGMVRRIGNSSLAFVRPTAGHAYRLEGSADGITWQTCGGHDDVRIMSPHIDSINQSFRYLRVHIINGIRGVWEWKIEEAQTDDFAHAKWIALEADSTILFPYIHLLKANSPEGQSLKSYRIPVLSKTCRVKGKVKRAWVDICGLGQYELFINGEKMGCQFLSPGWTMYNRELLYNELDVTQALQQAKHGKVAIEVMLGGGMYDISTRGYHKMAGSSGAPKLLFCLHVDFKDGQHKDFVSDATWKARESGIRHTSIYSGEWRDATLSAKSHRAVITSPYWDVPLVKQQAGTLVKIHQELPTTEIAPGIYDTRQNCSGIIRIKVKGKRGQTIRLRPAEILKNGAISQKSMPGYEWQYTLRGDTNGETWQPQFSYTGFRYVEVRADEGVELQELTGLHTSTDAVEVGSFECSDTLFNRIHTLIDWAIRSNLVSITTDCPTREKLGWQEQNHLMALSMMYRYDIRSLMNKIADDLADSQHGDGAIPTIAPEYTQFELGSGFEDTPEWGASFILCPWYTYQWYGDDSAMQKHYEAMKRYIAYLGSRAEGGILNYGLGDWFDIGPKRPGKAQLTSVALSATAMYYYELTVMQQIARHLGRNGDAEAFARTAEKVKEAFARQFYNGSDKVYENGSQTGLAMALYTGIAADSLRQRTLDALVHDIEQRGYALSAGDVGFRYVVQALQQNGRSDIVYRMNRSDSIPGYAYQLKQGATALTESWQAYDDVSNNHLMLGHLMEWLYSAVGGIRQTDNAWRHIVIAPQMVGEVTWAKTSLSTHRGKVSCHWTRDMASGEWTISVSIPEGSDAELHLPDGRTVTVGAGEHSISSQPVREQELWIKNGQRNIYGVLSSPNNGQAKHPVAIIAHGFNGTHDWGRNYFKTMSELGYMCYTFDFPCGSTGSRSDNNTMNMSILDEQSDLEAIVRHFCSRPDVDTTNIVLIGESQGGLVSALTATAMSQQTSKLVLVFPALCIPDNWNSRYPHTTDIPDTTRVWQVPLGRRFFMELRDMDPYKAVESYTRPVLIIHGDADNVVPIDYSRRAVKLYKDARLKVIPKAGHGFNPQDFQKSLEWIRQFLTDE